MEPTIRSNKSPEIFDNSLVRACDEEVVKIKVANVLLAKECLDSFVDRPAASLISTGRRDQESPDTSVLVLKPSRDVNLDASALQLLDGPSSGLEVAVYQCCLI